MPLDCYAESQNLKYYVGKSVSKFLLKSVNDAKTTLAEVKSSLKDNNGL